MDNMSSIGSDLPRKKSGSQQLKDLDSEVLSEFKTAACAVTKLFKLSGARVSAAKDEGYLQAIQDLLTVLNDTNGQVDVVEWALDKKRKLCGEESGGEEENDERHRNTSVRPFTYSSPLKLDLTSQQQQQQQQQHQEDSGDTWEVDLQNHIINAGMKRKGNSMVMNRDKKQRTTT